MQVFFFFFLSLPLCQKAKRNRMGWEEHTLAGPAICFLKELCPKVFRHHSNSHALPPGPGQSGLEPKPEAAATVAHILKQRPGAWLRPSAHCRHHLTRNEQQAPLSRNLLVATITCPPCMQISFDQVLHSQMWLRDSPLGLTTETGFRSQISVRYLFF